MAGQLDLFAPKPERAEWRDGEERGLSGRIGTAKISIRVMKTKDGFRWRAEFHAHLFGACIPWSRDARETATEAFGEASAYLRACLGKNNETEWLKRYSRWAEDKSAFDLAA
jgi:hypothetical protein